MLKLASGLLSAVLALGALGCAGKAQDS